MKVKEALLVLGVRGDATLEEMLAAFKRRILRAHPDKVRDGEDEAAAKAQTQTLLAARDSLLASGLFKAARKPPATPSHTAEAKWREQCAKRRAQTAEARERLWESNRAKAQEARAEEWRAHVKPRD
jgi:hypothetical protein